MTPSSLAQSITTLEAECAKPGLRPYLMMLGALRTDMESNRRSATRSGDKSGPPTGEPHPVTNAIPQ
jgi:hypothetical protein